MYSGVVLLWLHYASHCHFEFAGCGSGGKPWARLTSLPEAATVSRDFTRNNEIIARMFRRCQNSASEIALIFTCLKYCSGVKQLSPIFIAALSTRSHPPDVLNRRESRVTTTNSWFQRVLNLR